MFKQIQLVTFPTLEQLKLAKQICEENSFAKYLYHNMFSSHNHLKRKTPEQGINRQEFIEHLVEEYYTTTNVGE